MKRTLSLLLFAGILCVILQGNKPVVEQHETTVAQKVLVLDYTWYTDYSMFEPTGTVCSISDEIDRLRTLWPEYVFSNFPSMGLDEFEYGYYSPVHSAVIYSNLNP